MAPRPQRLQEGETLLPAGWGGGGWDERYYSGVYTCCHPCARPMLFAAADFDVRALHRMSLLGNRRTYMTVVAGLVTGILGVTDWMGFAIYLISQMLVGALSWGHIWLRPLHPELSMVVWALGPAEEVYSSSSDARSRGVPHPAPQSRQARLPGARRARHRGVRANRPARPAPSVRAHDPGQVRRQRHKVLPLVVRPAGRLGVRRCKRRGPQLRDGRAPHAFLIAEGSTALFCLHSGGAPSPTAGRRWFPPPVLRRDKVVLEHVFSSTALLSYVLCWMIGYNLGYVF